MMFTLKVLTPGHYAIFGNKGQVSGVKHLANRFEAEDWAKAWISSWPGARLTVELQEASIQTSGS